MKIFILGNQARSMANFWKILVRHMCEAGHEVVCVCPPGDEGEAEARLTAPGARIRHYPLDRKGLNPLRDMRTCWALLQLFREEKPQLLFASTIKAVIYGCLAARAANVPHIYAGITGLGYAFEADTMPKRLLFRLSRLLYRAALSGAEGIFFQNRDDVALFRETGILNAAARVLIAHGTGVDTQRFFPVPFPDLEVHGKPTPIFLLVARLLTAKGLPEYAAAAKILKARYPEARFQVLGPPEHGPGSIGMEQVRQWQETCGIEYLGETRDVRPFVQAAHVLVLPSWREGTPTCILEGMSMGRPAVVSDAPGCREAVREGVNGFLVPPRDAAALAAAMERFILQPEDIARMGAAGRGLALDMFDAELVAARMLDDMRVPVPAVRTSENRLEVRS